MLGTETGAAPGCGRPIGSRGHASRIASVFLRALALVVPLAPALAQSGQPFAIASGGMNVGGRAYNVQTGSMVRGGCYPNGDYLDFDTQPGTFWSGDRKQDRIRSEVQSRDKQPIGQTIDVSYSLYLDAKPGILSESLVLGQFHRTPDKGDFDGYPVFELNLHKDGLYVFTAGGADAIDPPHEYPHIPRASAVPFALDTWHKIAIQIRFSYSGQGMLKVMLDGQPIVDADNITIGFNDAVGPYWKFGLYYRPPDVPMVLSARYYQMSVGGQPVTSAACRP